MPDKMSIRPNQVEENNGDSDEDDDGDQHEEVQSEEDIARFFFLPGDVNTKILL
jgi:hypothetical protein